MSIDLNWETLTSGPDGEALAERIRAFIHDKFQTVPLPRFIRSVNVHGFDFGSIPPELELKDITDPLPDFYEQDLDHDDDEDDDDETDDEYGAAANVVAAGPNPAARERQTTGSGRTGQRQRKGRFAGLLQEVKVESEIGERDGPKQSLKNVGKVERFVLEQVRRIFEEEFVYPSFWTFLV
ncbi:phosphatidylinositol-4-phosphate 5-kinase fab1 [Ophiocordyceps sinensis CO18]|uniref:Phosphatidylinositol-4-phosphate 5-kinase fab1 n=1 Tax=Ophiocordyceps sinensis (strain Co18 / CGMCC 3.14243) TaxID=911162 RepID=T5AKL2_OPHSC|nr:phosphatidylinositol-4-phosphate 5-kinase fab1 [Ophiocordyceps sinensis CO18]